MSALQPKSCLKKLGKVALALVILASVLFAYMLYLENIASTQAKDFCSQIVIGSTVVGLVEKALVQGADEHIKLFKGQDELPIIFTGTPPFSRHICWVKVKDGRIISAKVVHLD